MTKSPLQFLAGILLGAPLLFPLVRPRHLTLCPSALEREVGLTFQFFALCLCLILWKRAFKHNYLGPSQPGMLSVPLRELRREKAGMLTVERRLRVCCPARGCVKQARSQWTFGGGVIVHSCEWAAAGCRQQTWESGGPGLESWLWANWLPYLSKGTGVMFRSRAAGKAAQETGDMVRGDTSRGTSPPALSL